MRLTHPESLGHMNKLKILTKRLVRASMIGGALIAIGVGAYAGASMLSSDSEKQKQDVENKNRSDKSLVEDLKRQLANSDEADKRFMLLQEKRRTDNYAGGSDALIAYLKNEKLRYKFEPFNLSRLQKATLSDDPQLKNLTNYEVSTRPLQFKITATSDLHVFSFINDLQADVSGILRIDGITFKRLADLSDATIVQLSNGGKLSAVEASIDLTWVTVAPKGTDNPSPTGEQ